MKVSEFVAKLLKLDQDKEIMMLENQNGGGCPREINLGPCEHVILPHEADDAADCEEIVGQTVYVVGYGCY